MGSRGCLFQIESDLAANSASPLPWGEVGAQPKSDMSDFGQFKLPNSGIPEFGCAPGEGLQPIENPRPPHPNPLQSKSDISDFGQTKMPNSGKPELGWGEGARRVCSAPSTPYNHALADHDDLSGGQSRARRLRNLWHEHCAQTGGPSVSPGRLRNA